MRSSRFAHAALRVRSHARGVHAAAALEHARLREELETVRAKLRRLEADNPALAAEQQKLDGLLASHAAENPELRSDHNRTDKFAPPKLHHINIVSRECDRLLHFYRDVMRMDEMPIEMFPRNAEGSSGQGGSNVPICFTTDGHMQMHLATQDLGVAQRSGESINPIGVGPIGHIAYRTDDIDAFKAHLDACGVAYSDYGTRFARDWHQIFFLDPEGVIVEVHAVQPK